MTQLTPVGQEIFDRRYQRNDESPDDMFARVAKHLASVESKDKRSKYEEEFFNLMSPLKFLPNSPTLFSAGTGQGLLSGCHHLVVEDSLVSMMECHRLAGLIMKYGGGVGYALGQVRPKGSPIKSIHGRACGPVALLPYYNEIANLIAQAGKRAGAQIAILPIDHPDAKEFITYKNKNPDELDTFNISVAITNEFMADWKEGSEKARELLGLVAESAWKTGCPGVFFIDRANEGNPVPWLGRIEGTNPCGEVPMLDKEACNIGSSNLAQYVRPHIGDMDWKTLARDVRLAIRLLDNVITANDFPDSVIHKAVEKTRKIGLGIMGWADVLALLQIPYDSNEALDLASKLMEFVSREADFASMELATEKGMAPAFQMNPSGTNGTYYRNVTRTCIAPTGSISQLAGCSSGIEPHWELEYERRMNDRGKWVTLPVREPVLDKLIELDIDFRPKTALEIDPSWHVQHQSTFQMFTNLAVSKTVNMPESATVEQVLQTFIAMWEQGCKGGTIYRNKSRETQVLGENREDRRRRLPDERQSITHKFRVGEQEGYLTVGLYEDGAPGEIFVKIAKEGSTIAGLCDAMALETSLLLQYGVKVDDFSHKLSGLRFEPAGPTGNPAIPFATSIPDYIYRWLIHKFGDIEHKPEIVGLFCPDCNEQLITTENCLRCRNKRCGYVRCG